MQQGARIGGTVLSIILAVSTLTALGVYGYAGASIDLAGYDEQTVEDTNDQLGQPEAEAYGTEEPGFFGAATGAIRALSVLWTLTFGLDDLIVANGGPAVVGRSVQMLAGYPVSLYILGWLRGYRP